MSIRKIEELVITSHYLKETISLFIVLPKDYTPFSNHPLVLASDGKDYLQLGRIVRTMDELIEEGEVEPFIFVGVPYTSVEERRRHYHPEGDKRIAYQNFLVHEVLPFLEAKYALAVEASNRVLLGDSLAATISLLTITQYPSIFGKAILQSPFVNDTVLQAVETCNQLDRLTIYQEIGLQEQAVDTPSLGWQDFLTPNRELHKLLNGSPCTYTYQEFAGNHTWKYWQPNLKQALWTILS